MTRIRTLACIALLASLAGCQDKAPANATASANKPADEPGGLAGMVGAAMDKARAEMEKKNISIGGNGVHINVDGHEINTPDDKTPRAEISPQGDLLVEGKPVDITPAQRALLLQYRGEIIGIASAGMEIGKQGVGMAGKAVSTAIASIFNGKSDQVEQEMKAQGERIEAQAMKLCDQMQPMLKTQQELAASLPAFKPYANLEQSDIDDCRKHDKGDGVAVFSDTDRDNVRHEIRDTIRESIRSTVRTPSGDSDSHDDAAAEADAAAAKGG
ncbi:MAG TPA: DUF2884 family protein [Lysobacter sp.]|nr:DUF2884 family protein [Lysobacter sp.]